MRRAERVGKNEALFRAVNDRVAELGNPNLAQTLEILCECGDRDCVEQISLPIGTYERIREDPLRFAVVPGHAEERVERVVESTERYHVVQKRPGLPTELARGTNPRG